MHRMRFPFVQLAIVATSVALLGLAPPTARSESAGSDIRLVGSLTRTDTGFVQTPVFAQPGDPTPLLMLGGESPVPPVVLVTKKVDGWAEVMVAQRRSPGSAEPVSGWMELSKLEVSKPTYSVSIDRAKHMLRVRLGGATVQSMRIAAGIKGLPTPAVSTFLVSVSKLSEFGAGANSPAGPLVMDIAAWSEQLENYRINPLWSGLVIQGTNCAKTCLGKDVTNGSIRVSNKNVMWLAEHLDLGTPITVT